MARGGPRSTAPPVVRKFAIETRVESGTYGNARWVEISPDGSRLAFQSERGLEVRELSSLESRLLVPASDLANGANGAAAFWSPDGASIAYAALGSLRRVAVAGGAPRTICKLAGDENGGVWMADDMIVFTTTRGPMYRVRAGGGDPEVILSPDPKEELDFHQPSALPDGRGLVYSVHRLRGVDTIEMLRDGKRSVVLRVDSGPINLQDSPQIVNVPFYSPTGHLLYQRDQGNVGLWALPFSIEKGVATGEPFLVAPGMENGSVANDGTLVYSGKAGSVSAQLTLVSRDGKLERTLGEALPDLRVGTFSADGRRLLYEAAERQASDLYVWEFDGDRGARLTNTPEAEYEPVWIPGSGRVAFSAPSESCRAVFGMNADGTGARELLVEKASEPWFAPGGGELVYTSTCQKSHGVNRFEIAQKSDSPLLDAAAGIDSATLSPDGRYLAYRSWEGGKAQLYLTRYPSLDGRWLVAEAESVLRWARDGSEVYYLSPSPDRMMAAPVRLDPVFSIGEARPLFELAPLGVPRQSRFDVSPDGRRFAMIRETAPSENKGKIVVVENWFEEFRKP